MNRFRLIVRFFRNLFVKTSETTENGLKKSDDLMGLVAPDVMQKGKKFWFNNVLYSVTNVRKDGKIILKVIAGKKGLDVVRGK